MVVSLADSGCTPLPLRKTHFGYTRQIVNLDSAKTRRPEIMPIFAFRNLPNKLLVPWLTSFFPPGRATFLC